MKSPGIWDGVRSGVILGACAVALAVLGLTPSLAWIPEIPLLVVATLVPVGILGWTGFRARSRSGRTAAGLLTGALAGAIGGSIGGVAYLLYGKPAINIPIGLLGGAMAGGVVGLLGAIACATLERRLDRAAASQAPDQHHHN